MCHATCWQSTFPQSLNPIRYKTAEGIENYNVNAGIVFIFCTIHSFSYYYSYF